MTISAPEPHAEALEDLPPSCVLAYRVLSELGESSSETVAEEAYMSDRTARHALSKLEEADVVESRTDPTELRRLLYDIAE